MDVFQQFLPRIFGDEPLWYDGMLLNILCSHKESNFDQHFIKLTDNRERIAFCLSHNDGKIGSFLDSYIEKFHLYVDKTGTGKKLSHRAESFRMKGNECFKKERYLVSIQEYSKAILNAPKVPLAEDLSKRGKTACKRELALAFGNRSAAYFRLGLYEYALLDVEAALEEDYRNYGDETKLRLRALECLLRLGRMEEAKRYFLIYKPVDLKEGDKWTSMEKFINGEQVYPSLTAVIEPRPTHQSTIEALVKKGMYKPNSKLTSLDAKVKVDDDPTKGMFALDCQ